MTGCKCRISFMCQFLIASLIEAIIFGGIMELVKVNNDFYNKCIKNGTTEEIMFNEQRRPCVLILRLKYKNKKGNL